MQAPRRAGKASDPTQAHDAYLSRLIAVGRKLDTEDVKLAVRQTEALLTHRSEVSRRKRNSATRQR